MFIKFLPTPPPSKTPTATLPPPVLPTPPTHKSPTLHTRAWDLQALERQPTTKHIVSHFEKAYHFTLPSMDTSPISNPFYEAISRNFCNCSHVQTKIKFVVDSSANRHMCNSRHLFITITPYTGKNKYVTLGDGTIKCQIQGIVTMDITLPNRSKLRFHNVIYVPTLNVSLFSIKQHMRYTGYSEHSQNNICTIAFPNTRILADNKEEIEFSVIEPLTDHTIAPTFDEATAELYEKENTNIILQSSPRTSKEVTITSTQKSHPVQYLPTQATPESIGYELRAPAENSIPPQGLKTIPLGFKMSIPPGLYGRFAPRSGLDLHKNIDVAAGVIEPDYRGEIKVVLVNNSQKSSTFDVVTS